MLEIAAFTGALSSISALIKVANESKNVEMTNKLIDLQQKISSMQGDFGEMQQKLFEAQQENCDLKEKQRGLDDDAAFRATLKYDEQRGIWSRIVTVLARRTARLPQRAKEDKAQEGWEGIPMPVPRIPKLRSNAGSTARPLGRWGKLAGVLKVAPSKIVGNMEQLWAGAKELRSGVVPCEARVIHWTET